MRRRPSRTGPSSSSIPCQQPAADRRVQRPRHVGQVGLDHPVRRVHQQVGQLAVVGQQQQALAVGVQSPDVEEPLGPVRDEVGDGGAAAVIRHGAQHPRGLFSGQVDQVGADDRCGRRRRAIDRGRGVDPGAELVDDHAVDRDPAVGDQLFAGPPRAHPGRGQHLLQPDRAWSRIARMSHPQLQSSSVSSVSSSGNKGAKRGQLGQRLQAHLLQEQVSGAVQAAAGLGIGTDLGDQARG